VPQARIMKIWNIPQAFTAENDRLALVAQLLVLARLPACTSA